MRACVRACMCVCSTYGLEQTVYSVKHALRKRLRENPKRLIKTGACLIQVKLHLVLQKEPLNTGDCLMLVAFKTGLIILGSSLGID